MESILNQITLFAFFQAIFLLTISIASSSKRTKVNGYLMVLIGVLIIGLIGEVGQHSLGWRRQVKGFSEFSVLLFGPTIYLFILSTLSDKQYSKKDLVHYIPAIIHSVIVTFYYILPPEAIVLERLESGELFRVVRILVGIGLVVNSTYLIMSINKYRVLRQSLQDERSYALNLLFVRNFLLAICACVAIWLCIYLVSLGYTPELEVYARQFIWIAVALIVLFIAYYQMISPSVFLFHSEVRKEKYTQSKFSAKDLDHLQAELESIMASKKPYLNAKLLKSELAQMMRINAPEMSRLLNERIGMSFFEYVNYHRIQEFIRLSRTPLAKEMTLLGIAQEAGFHSKSTFNKSFKQIMGCPPSEYIKKANQ